MIRSLKERIVQTLCYEIGGILLSIPVLIAFTQGSESEALAILVTMSIAVMCWVGLHNTLFDWLELKFTQRPASDRPNGMRIVHALSHELSSIIVSLPILIWLSGLNWQKALLADTGLTMLYVVYAFIFYRIYDAIRPVQIAHL